MSTPSWQKRYEQEERETESLLKRQWGDYGDPYRASPGGGSRYSYTQQQSSGWDAIPIGFRFAIIFLVLALVLGIVFGQQLLGSQGTQGVLDPLTGQPVSGGGAGGGST